MTDPTSRAISTVGIWIAVAVVLAAGVFQKTWTGTLAVLFMLATVAVICGAAAYATAAIWNAARMSDNGSGQRLPPNLQETTYQAP